MTKILVVDDNAFMRKMLGRLIETEQNSFITEAGSSESALNAVREKSFDIILIDISLENEDSGIELIKKIRAEGNKTPILCISLHEEVLYAERIKQAGAQGYLMKQDAGENITAALAALLEGGNYWPATQPAQRS
jgi:two-component system invasion response regulator UvrY